MVLHKNSSHRSLVHPLFNNFVSQLLSAQRLAHRIQLFIHSHTKNMSKVRKQLQDILNQRIMVIDGAMGSMIQKYKLTEKDFRGTRFVDHKKELKGDTDLLNITRPDVIGEIHEKYLEAGADIIETNTFGANQISQADYEMEKNVYEMNFCGAQIAKKAAEKYTKKDPSKPRFVAGAIGPTTKSASVSRKVEDSSYRDISKCLTKKLDIDMKKPLINW